MRKARDVRRKVKKWHVEGTKREKKEEEKENNTSGSNVVPHRSTNEA